MQQTALDGLDGRPRCGWCRGLLPAKSRSDSITCSQPCRQKLHRLAQYGFTPESFEAMLVAQNNACAICERSFAKLTPNIDHDHLTGFVRGIVCNYCNRSLGRLVDKPERFARVIAYVNAPQRPELRFVGKVPRTPYTSRRVAPGS